MCLTRRDIALLVGLATALVTWYSWGAWRPTAVVPDEYSYILQAKIFASGHWVAPAPPSESAFQQSHVLVTPHLASKYPPGHSILLAAGAILDAVWLVPIALAGITGAVLFLVLAEQGPLVIAICGWAYWLCDPISLRFRPGYYSESTSGLTWVLAWWLVGRVRESPRRLWLVLLSMTVAWCAITRPVTAIALAVPIAIYLSRGLIAQRAWKDVGTALAAGVAVLTIFAFANTAITGHPLKTSFALYREQYLPFDKLGFHVDSTPPRFRLAPPSADTYRELIAVHDDQVLARLPKVAWVRLRELAVTEWTGWRVLLVPVIALGLFGLQRLGWLAIANAAFLFACYLTWAHWHGWTIYYVEGLSALAIVFANGLQTLRRRWPSMKLAQAAIVAAGALFAAMSWRTLTMSRANHIEAARYATAFHRAVADLPFSGAVVFIRYSKDQYPHHTLVVNSPTWSTDALWVVNSWGPSADLRLLSASGQRAPLVFDEKTGLISTYHELLDSLRQHARK